MTEQYLPFKVQAMDPKPLMWWKARRSKIDMSPPYQRRGRLWSATDKAYLIDSILNGFDVPKFYMADFTWGDSALNQNRLPYAIIDGKQRFEAIFDFFDGKLVLNEDFIYRTQPELKLGGLGYQDLKDNYVEIAEIFETYPLTIMAVLASTDEPINELFVRLNRSKSLTGAEIRNAVFGPATDIVREISKHDFFNDNICFSVKRGADLNAAAKLLLFEFRGEPSETKKRILDIFVEATAAQNPEHLELSARRVMERLGQMAAIFLPKDKLLGSEGILPVYYWLVRSIEVSKHHKVREFLVDFERQRKENRELAKLGEENLDASFVKFDNLNRSTNDLQSHIGRFDILRAKFRQWAKS
jgi:hypothetical protein